MSTKQKQKQYTVRLDWNRPVIGYGFPPKSAIVNPDSKIKIPYPGDSYEYQVDRDFYVHIGSLQPWERPLLYHSKEEAQRIANKIPGAFVEEY